MFLANHYFRIQTTTSCCEHLHRASISGRRRHHLCECQCMAMRQKNSPCNRLGTVAESVQSDSYNHVLHCTPKHLQISRTEIEKCRKLAVVGYFARVCQRPLSVDKAKHSKSAAQTAHYFQTQLTPDIT